tara:strand:+ start:4803 stop:5051 length:249 start_codon:yes stop_codon:yes gene_type:complete
MSYNAGRQHEIDELRGDESRRYREMAHDLALRHLAKRGKDVHTDRGHHVTEGKSWGDEEKRWREMEHDLRTKKYLQELQHRA